MANALLVERLGNTTGGDIIIPLDSSYISEDPVVQEEIISTTIMSQPETPEAMNGYQYLHSVMKNQFYQNLFQAVTSEGQNKIEYADVIRTLYDIWYFNGDQEAFNQKISAGFALLGFNPPSFYAGSLFDTNAGLYDANTNNDWFRNLLLHVYLIRQWRGTRNTYDLMFRLLNRLGAIHIGTKYPGGATATTTTEKYYRLLDISKFVYALPNPSNPSLTAFPNSPHIDGADSFQSASKTYYYWDTQLTWDMIITQTPSIDAGATGIVFTKNSWTSPYTFTVTSVAGAVVGVVIIAGKTIYLNSIDIASTTAVASKIASSFIAGYSVSNPTSSQVTLTFTGNAMLSWDSSIPFLLSGKAIFTEFSLDRLLTHNNSIGTTESLLDLNYNPAIDVFLPEVARATDNVLNGSQITLVTDSSGFSNNLSLDVNKYSHPNIKAKFQVFPYLPDRLTNNWSSSSTPAVIKIGTGGYSNPTISNYVFNNALVPDLPTGTSRIIPSNIDQPLFQTNIGANELSSFGAYKVVSVVVHPRTISNATISGNPSNIVNPSTDGLTEYPSYFALTGTYVAQGSVSLGAGFSLSDSVGNIANQRIFLKEEINQANGRIDTVVYQQQLDAFGQYATYVNDSMHQTNYSGDGYSLPSNTLLPTSQKNAIQLRQLNAEDLYPTLQDSLRSRFYFDASPSLDKTYGSSASLTKTAGVTAGSAGLIAGNLSWLFPGSADYGSTPGIAGNSGLTAFSISLFFKNATAVDQTDVILSAKGDGTTLGWVLLYSYNASTFATTLTFKMKATASMQTTYTYTRTSADSGWHGITVTYDSSFGTQPPSMYVDGVRVGVSSNVGGAYIVDTISNPLYFGGNGANGFIGNITETFLHARALTAYEINGLFTTTLIRGTAQTDSNGNPMYAYTDHTLGIVCVKMKFNPAGPWATIGTAYTNQNFTLIESFKTAVAKDPVAITEMGLFDASGNLLAYATFPPVIYDANKYHLAFNLFIESTVTPSQNIIGINQKKQSVVITA